jgi:transglutaminase-like putative cysteine protease
VLGVALVLPFLGAWAASTLASHHGASPGWAAAAGLGLSLGLPLVWELLSLPRRQARGVRPKRWLRLRTRLLLRTWTVSLAFLVGALLLSPRGVFTALSTRGDWMLPAAGPPHVETARRLLFAAAEGVEWVYVLATDNPYRDQLIAIAPSAPSQQPPPPPRPPQPPVPPPAEPPVTEQPPPSVTEAPQEPVDDGEADVFLSWKSEPRPHEPEPVRAEPVAPEREVPEASMGQAGSVPSTPLGAGGTTSYPLPVQLHARVVSLPRDQEKDLVTVAKYLVSGEKDPFQRIKALHDYVANRVEYDVPAYRSRNFPPQTPEAVFQNRRAVCAGYANLFAAMGQAVGEEIVTLTGDVPTPTESWEFESHAWNAVRIEGEWYLVDVTWNAGYVNGDVFTRQYKTEYLFMPPREFLQRHLPEEPAWQLLEKPLERGEAMRQARAYIQERHAHLLDPQKPRTERPTGEKRVWEGIRILAPSAPGSEVRGRFIVELDNPRGLPAEVVIVNLQDSSQEPCPPEYRGRRYACTVLSRGSYRIQVFSDAQTSAQLMTQLEVTGL